MVHGISEGDEIAFKFVFDQYYRPLTLFALKYVADIEEAKEVVQDFFVRFWYRRNSLKITFSLKMYLYQSVKNACLNYLETNKVKQRRMQNYSQAVLSTENALENLILAEQEELLMKAIDKLPQKCREIFVLSRMNKLSNQAISNQLQISVKTVEAQISIALKRLLQSLITLLVFLLLRY
nr:RNA polymerase sigma-70 factor [Chryseosolibacter indicus]